MKTPAFSFRLYRNFLVSTLLPFVAITLLIAYIYQQSYRRDITRLVNSNLVSVAENVSVYLAELGNISLVPYYSEDYAYAITKARESRTPDSQIVYELNQSIGNAMSFLRYTRADIASAVVVVEDYCLYYTNNNPNAEILPEYDYAAQEWYQNAIAQRGSSVFVKTHEPGYFTTADGAVFSVARAIMNLEKRTPLCVVKIDANTSTLEKVLAQIDLHVASRLVILDENGSYIFSPDGTAALPAEPLEGAQTIRHDGQTFAVYSQTISPYGWQVFALLDQTEMNKQTIYIYCIAAILYVVGMAIALLFYRASSGQIIRDMQVIEQSIERIQKGDFSARVTIQEGHQLKLLGDSLNHMSAQLQARIEREYVLTIQQKNAELRALQSQINPHFLFNTLNSIIGLNQSGRTDKVTDAMYALTYLLRETFSKETVIPLAQEFGFIENYCALQKMRYWDKLEYTLALEEDLRGFRIVKLLLQPLVENAIVHGVEPSVGKCHLTIRARRLADGRAEITVQDDGAGFSGEGAAGGIGLGNVKQRLAALHPNNTFRIEGAKELGTTVTLELEEVGQDAVFNSGR